MSDYKVIFVKKEEILQNCPQKIQRPAPLNIGTFIKKPQTVVNLPPLPRKYVRQTNREGPQIEESKRDQLQVALLQPQRPVQINIYELSAPSVSEEETLNNTIHSLDTKHKPPTEDFSIFDALKPCQASRYEYVQSISSGNTSEQYSIIEQDEFLTSFNQKFMGNSSDGPTEEGNKHSGLVREWKKEEQDQFVQIKGNEQWNDGKEKQGDRKGQQHQNKRWKNGVQNSSESIKIPTPDFQNFTLNDQIPTHGSPMLISRKYTFQVKQYLVPYEPNQPQNEKQANFQEEYKAKTFQATCQKSEENNRSEIYQKKSELMGIEEEDSFYECSHTQLQFFHQNKEESILKENTLNKNQNEGYLMSNSNIKSKSNIKINSGMKERLLADSYEVSQMILMNDRKEFQEMSASNIPQTSPKNQEMSCSIQRGMLNNFSMLHHSSNSGQINNTFSDQLKFVHNQSQENNLNQDQNPMLQGKYYQQSISHQLSQNLSEQPYDEVNQDELSFQQRENYLMRDSQFIEENPDEQLLTVQSEYTITEKSNSYIRISENQIQSEIDTDNRIDINNNRIFLNHVNFYQPEKKEEQQKDDLLLNDLQPSSSSAQQYSSSKLSPQIHFDNHSQQFYQQHMDQMDHVIVEILQMKKQFQLFYLNFINQQTLQSNKTNRMILKKLNSIQAHLDFSRKQNRVFKRSNLINQSQTEYRQKREEDSQILFSFNRDNQENQENIITNSHSKKHKIFTYSNKNSDDICKFQNNQSHQTAKNHLTLQNCRPKNLTGSVCIEGKQNESNIQFEPLEKSYLIHQKSNQNNQKENEIQKCKPFKTDKLIGNKSITTGKTQTLTHKEYKKKLLEEVQHNFKKNRQKTNKKSAFLKQEQQPNKYQKYLNEQSQQFEKERAAYQNDSNNLYQSKFKQTDSNNKQIQIINKTQCLSSLPCVTKVITPSQLNIAMEKLETHEEKKQTLLEQVYQFGKPSDLSQSLFFESEIMKKISKEKEKLELVEKNQLFNQSNDKMVKDSFWNSQKSNKVQSKYESKYETKYKQNEDVKQTENKQKHLESQFSISFSNSDLLKRSHKDQQAQNKQSKSKKDGRVVNQDLLAMKKFENKKIQNLSQFEKGQKKGNSQNLRDSLQNENSQQSNLLDSRFENIDRKDRNLLDLRQRIKLSEQSNFDGSGEDQKSAKEENLLDSLEKKSKQEDHLLFSSKEQNLLDSEQSKRIQKSERSQESNLLQSLEDNNEGKKLQKSQTKQNEVKHEQFYPERSQVRPMKSLNENYSVEFQISHNGNLQSFISTNQKHVRSLPTNLNGKSVNIHEPMIEQNSMQDFRMKNSRKRFGINEASNLINTSAVMEETRIQQQIKLEVYESVSSHKVSEYSSQIIDSSQTPVIQKQEQVEAQIKSHQKYSRFIQLYSPSSPTHQPLQQYNFQSLSHQNSFQHGSFAYEKLIQKHIAECKQNIQKSTQILKEPLTQKDQGKQDKEDGRENQEKPFMGFKELRERVINSRQGNKNHYSRNQIKTINLYSRITPSIIQADNHHQNAQSNRPVDVPLNNFSQHKNSLQLSSNTEYLSTQKDNQSLQQAIQSVPAQTKRNPSFSQPASSLRNPSSIYNPTDESTSNKSYDGQFSQEQELSRKGIKEHKIPVISFNKKLKQSHFCRGQTRKIPASIHLRRKSGSSYNNATNNNTQQYYSDPISQRNHSETAMQHHLPRINDKDSDIKFNPLPLHNHSIEILPDSPIYSSIYYDQTNSKTMNYKWFKFNPKSF